MSLTNELQEAINKNLPSTVGEELVKRLQQADEDSRKVEQLTRSNQSLLNDFRAVQAETDALRADLKKHEVLAVRETAVAQAERDLENRMLKHQLTVAEGSAQFARDVAMGLVRNAEFRRDVFNSNSGRQIAVPSGGYLGTGGSENSSTSITEQTK